MVAPIANLFDSFDDGIIGPIWTTSGTWAEGSGTICATMPSAGSSLTSASAWSLAQSSAFVEIVSFANGAGAASGAEIFRLFNSADSTDYVQFVLDPPTNTLFFQYVENSVIQSSSSITYNSTTMRWLRFRHFQDRVYFETSPDGATWTQRFSSTEPLWVGSVKVLLFTAQSGGAATTKCFDNFNVAPASARGVPVGPEFEVSTDGKLGLNRCDQADSAWGYPCSQSAYNALRRSENPCGLWVQPPPLQLMDVEAVLVGTTEEEKQVITLDLTNPDPCRYMSFYLPLTAGMRFTLEAGDSGSVIPVTSWTLGVQVTGVDNPDDSYVPIIAGDFHQPGTHLWRGVADYFWTAPPGGSTQIIVKLKVFKGGGASATITGFQARLGYVGWTEVDP